MRTITMTDAVLAIITNDADRETMSTMKGSDLPEDIVKDMVSTDTHNRLFANNNHPVAELMIEDSTDDDNTNLGTNTHAQESTMTQTSTDTKPATTLTFLGTEFECEFKMDKAFVGKTVTPEDFPKLSKHMLLAIIERMGNRIMELEMQQLANEQQQVKGMQERAQAVQQAQQVDHLQVLKREFWAQLKPNQKRWMQANDKANAKKVNWREVETGRYQVSFPTHSPNSQKVLADVLEGMAKRMDWYCKRQTTTIDGKVCVKHVYINMKLND